MNTSAWNVQSVVAGVATDSIPEPPSAEASSVPWDHSSSFQAAGLPVGMVKVVWAAKITGEWTTWANAAALSAAVNPATPTQAASRSAVRPVRCWGCVPIAVDGSDCPPASGGCGELGGQGLQWPADLDQWAPPQERSEPEATAVYRRTTVRVKACVTTFLVVPVNVAVIVR